jgi:hypothetical protein
LLYSSIDVILGPSSGPWNFASPFPASTFASS